MDRHYPLLGLHPLLFLIMAHLPLWAHHPLLFLITAHLYLWAHHPLPFQIMDQVSLQFLPQRRPHFLTMDHQCHQLDL